MPLAPADVDVQFKISYLACYKDKKSKSTDTLAAQALKQWSNKVVMLKSS